MNRYVGNSGMVERIPEPETDGMSQGIPAMGKFVNEKKPSIRSLFSGGLGGLFSKLGKSAPEFEDILLIAVLYLLYRESGDIEFLLIGGALLFL